MVNVSDDAESDHYSLSLRQKKWLPSGADMGQMMPLLPANPITTPKGHSSRDSLEEVGSVGIQRTGSSIHTGLGYNPYDQLVTTDPETARAQSLSTVSRTPTPPPAQNSAQGPVVYHTIGTMTARLVLSMETLVDRLFPQSAPSLVGRCVLVDQTAKLELGQEEVAGKLAQKKGSNSIEWIPVICRIVQTVLNTLYEAFRKIWHAQDELIPLLGRVTAVCLRKCEKLYEECKEMGVAAKSDIESGTRSLLDWMRALKALVFG